MHSQLPAILKCLYCQHEGLQLPDETERRQLHGQESVLTGKVVCPKCGATYPIEDGIINFLPRRTPNIGVGQRTNQFKITAWGYERFWRLKALTLLGGRDWPPEEELDTVARMLNHRRDENSEIPTHNEIAFYFDQGASTAFYGRGIIKAVKSGKLDVDDAEAHVVSVDNSWVMLQEARAFIERDGLTGTISLVRADVENLPFIEGAFAGMASGGSLNEFGNTAQAMSETYRTLDPDGNAVFMVQMGATNPVGRAINQFITATSGIKFFQPNDMLRYFQQAGFKLAEQQSSGLVTINHLVKAER